MCYRHQTELIESMKPEIDLATKAARDLSDKAPVGSASEKLPDYKLLHSFTHLVLAIKFGIAVGRPKADVLLMCDDVIKNMEDQIKRETQALTLDFGVYVGALKSMKSKVEVYEFREPVLPPSTQIY